MIKKYAIIKEDVVVEIRSIANEDLGTVMRECQNIVEVDAFTPKPVVGWRLDRSDNGEGVTLESI